MNENTYTVTARGNALATCLGVPAHDTATRGVVSAIARHAATLARLAEAECDGPAWLDAEHRRLGRLYRDGYHAEHAAAMRRYDTRMQRWGQSIERDQDRHGAAIHRLAALLNRAGVPVVPELHGDPRGFVVRLVWPANVTPHRHAEPCPTHGRAHCRGGAGGTLDAIGMDPNE
jgi:hypothetical protein